MVCMVSLAIICIFVWRGGGTSSSVIGRRLFFHASVSSMGWVDPGTWWERGLERGVERQTSLLQTQRLAPETWGGLALSPKSYGLEEESTKVAPSTWC